MAMPTPMQSALMMVLAYQPILHVHAKPLVPCVHSM